MSPRKRPYRCRPRKRKEDHKAMPFGYPHKSFSPRSSSNDDSDDSDGEEDEVEVDYEEVKQFSEEERIEAAIEDILSDAASLDELPETVEKIVDIYDLYHKQGFLYDECKDEMRDA